MCDQCFQALLPCVGPIAIVQHHVKVLLFRVLRHQHTPWKAIADNSEKIQTYFWRLEYAAGCINMMTLAKILAPNFIYFGLFNSEITYGIINRSFYRKQVFHGVPLESSVHLEHRHEETSSKYPGILLFGLYSSAGLSNTTELYAF